jgi:hypothetical protein
MPDVFCWTLVSKRGLCTCGAITKIVSLLQRMKVEGGNCAPNVVTYCHVLSFCRQCGLAEAPTRAEEVLQQRRRLR